MMQSWGLLDLSWYPSWSPQPWVHSVYVELLQQPQDRRLDGLKSTMVYTDLRFSPQALQSRFPL